jgi:hypothetical protein
MKKEFGREDWCFSNTTFAECSVKGFYFSDMKIEDIYLITFNNKKLHKNHREIKYLYDNFLRIGLYSDEVYHGMFEYYLMVIYPGTKQIIYCQKSTIKKIPFYLAPGSSLELENFMKSFYRKDIIKRLCSEDTDG